MSVYICAIYVYILFCTAILRFLDWVEQVTKPNQLKWFLWFLSCARFPLRRSRPRLISRGRRLWPLILQFVKGPYHWSFNFCTFFQFLYLVKYKHVHTKEKQTSYTNTKIPLIVLFSSSPFQHFVDWTADSIQYFTTRILWVFTCQSWVDFASCFDDRQTSVESL